MGHYPNFRDFYGRVLVPMGDRDHDVYINKAGFSNKGIEDGTHWYLAIEGVPEEEEGTMKWRVVVHAAKSDGTVINLQTPQFYSKTVATMDDALVLSREIELHIWNDSLFGSASNLEMVQ